MCEESIAMNPIFISKLNGCPCTFKTRRHRPGLFLIVGSTVLAVSLLGSSCATSRGFGQDVKKVGNKIERAASR